MVRASEEFIATRRRDGPIEYSFELLEDGGFVHKFGAGSFGFLAPGIRTVDNIVRIAEEEMSKAGSAKVDLPLLQTADVWRTSGRWAVYGDEMVRLTNRKGAEFCLAPTAEEYMTQLVKQRLQANKQLPFTIFQIKEKFRDELRPRHGLLRAVEFLMLDGYSFDSDEPGLDTSYNKMRTTFEHIFTRAGLEFVVSAAETGEIGGTFSEEFLAPASYGEDEVVKNDGTRSTGIELGHIFKLGDKYSKAFDLTLQTENGHVPVQMGCYGIGMSRMLPAIVEQHTTGGELVLPVSVAPYKVGIVVIGEDSEEHAKEAEAQLSNEGVVALLDDRRLRAGPSFKDMELLGTPIIAVYSSRNLSEGLVEVIDRRDNFKTYVNAQDVTSVMQRMIGQ